MFRTKYLIQINYKSGNSMQFWVYKFTMNDNEFTWDSAGPTRPIRINIDEVESVWQIRAKRFI